MKTYFLWLLTLLSLTSQAQTIVKQRISFSLNGVLTEGKIHRNYDLYPATSAGDQAVRAAVESGTVSVTLSSGYRAGAVAQAYVTRPPSTTTTTPTTSWLSQARYSFDANNLLYVEANGESGMQLAFGFSGTNPDNVNIVSGTYYGYGSNVNSGYPYQWKVYKQAGGATSLTFRRHASSSETVTYQVTPTSGQTNVSLTGGSTTTPPSTTATEFQTPAVSGTGVQLTINCASSTARIVGKLPSGSTIGVYLYKDNVLVASRDNLAGPTCDVTLSGISGNGTYKARVFELGNDGNALTSPNLVVTCGSTTPTTPTAPTTPAPPVTGTATEYVAYADQGWSGADLKTIESSQMVVGFKRSVGATICVAKLKSDNVNLVNDYKVVYDDDPNDPRYGQIVSDKGRQWMFGSDYFTPLPNPNGYTINGKNTRNGYKGHVFNTGGNTVQGGSLWPALDESQVLASAIVNHPTRGLEFYAKIRARVWGVKGELGHIILEEWISFKTPTTIAYYARHTVEERGSTVPEQRSYESVQQENPCLYVIAPLTTHRAVTGTPWVNGGTVDRFPTEWNQPGKAPFSPVVFTSESWIGAYQGGGRGVTLYSPINSAYCTGQFGDVWGDENSGASSYLNNCLEMNYDNPGVYDDYGYIILGTESEARSIIYNQLPRPDQSFDFDFSQDNHRWNNHDCRVKRESNRDLVMYLDAKVDNGVSSTNGNFMAPSRAWDASGITSIKFRMAVTGVSKLRLKFVKPGQANTAEFYKYFDVVGDGVERTYEVSTADPNWSGTISSVGIMGVSDAGVTQPGAKIVLRRIYK